MSSDPSSARVLPEPGAGGSATSDQLAMMELVYEVTRRFAGLLDLNEVLAEVLSLTVDTLGADEGSIFLLDQDQRVSHHILARRNLPPEESAQVVSAVLDKGLAGWALRQRRAALVQDTQTDARWYHLPGDELNTRSAIAVPLVYRKHINGLLTLTHSQPCFFGPEHLELAAALAVQAATAVENARLFTSVRDERAVLQALINGVQDPIIVTDAKNRVRYINPAVTVLDERLGQAVGQPIEAVIPSDELNRLFHQLLDSGQPQHAEIPWPDGRTFDATLAQVPDVGSVAVLHDVTHFKELDRMKSEFVATASHDLKAPLGVIYGYVELLEDILPDLNDVAARCLKEITGSAARMQTLIVTLLDLAQIEAGLDRAAIPCEIPEIISDVLRNYHLQAKEKEITFKIDVDDEMPVIMGHPVRLGQAISNLVGNALKYTPPRGRVTVAAQAENQKIVVQVSDTGPGIPPAKQAGLFGKFYKVGAKETRAQEGHGLGLAIVKSVVEAHGGRAWVESTVGQGSTFAFALPLEKDEG
jgi:two-component system phosphate regulon sensor histidine kinase PhoR